MVDTDPSQRPSAQDRKFNISLKTPHEWLASQRSWSDWLVRVRITDDIVANAMELESGVEWGVVLNHIISISDRQRYVGKSAITQSIAMTVGAVASNMGWHMHSPEVVYMSGFHPFWSLSKDLAILNRRLEEAEEGKRKFISEEAEEETIEREKREAGKIGAYRRRIGDSLEVYSQQTLPSNPLYLDILQGLLYLGHSKARDQRYRIFELLKKGKLEETAQILHPTN